MSTSNSQYNSNDTGNGTNRTSKVHLTLHAQKLKNVAGAFKGTSDPYAVVALVANSSTEQPRVIGKTEV